MSNLMQLSKSNRHNNNITAHKVIEAGNNSLTIWLPWNELTTLQLPGNPYAAGTWIDAQLSYNIRGGKIGSYSVCIIGETPAAFIPADPDAEYALS